MHGYLYIMYFMLFDAVTFRGLIIMLHVSKSSSIHNSCFDRQQDVRATEIDKVDMHLSFRPGDIVRALVVLLLLEEFK